MSEHMAGHSSCVQQQIPMIGRLNASICETAPDVANYMVAHDDSVELHSLLLSLTVDTCRAIIAQGSRSQKSSEHASLVDLITRFHKDLKSNASGVANQISASVMHDMEAKLTHILSASQKDLADNIKGGLVQSVNSTLTEAYKHMSDISSDVKAQQSMLSSHASSMMANMTALVMAVSKAAEKIDMDKLALVIESANSSSQAKLCTDLVNLIGNPLAQELRNVCDDYNHMPMMLRDLDARVSQMLTTLFTAHKDNANMNQQQLADHVKQVPALTNSIMSEVIRQLSNQQQNLASMLVETRTDLASISTSIASVDARVASSKLETELERAKRGTRKGADAEEQLFDLLTDILKARDGFEVEKTGGQTASCDILVKRIGSPDIRIESKAHGQASGEKVRHNEVAKFQRDLVQSHSHGIFISLYTDIVGVSNFELQQLPTGKFAVYLTKLNFDIEPVVEMIHLLYKLDTIVSRNQGADDDAKSDTEPVIKVPATNMAHIQHYLKEYAMTVSSAKQHMRSAIRQLGDLDMDKIVKLLLENNSGDLEDVSSSDQEGGGDDKAAGRGAGVQGAQQPPATLITCELGCGASFKKKANMTRHVQKFCELRQNS